MCGLGTSRGFGEGRQPCLKTLEMVSCSQFPSRDGTRKPAQEHDGGGDVGRMPAVQGSALCSRGHVGSGICRLLEEPQHQTAWGIPGRRSGAVWQATHWQAEVNAGSRGTVPLKHSQMPSSHSHGLTGALLCSKGVGHSEPENKRAKA